MRKKKKVTRFSTTLRQLAKKRIQRGISFEDPERRRLKQLLKKRRKAKGRWVGSYWVPD